MGARRRDIPGQFLIAALTLSLTGRLIGIAVGAIASFAIGHWARRQTELRPSAILLSFGFFPARKASHLQPIEALRCE